MEFSKYQELARTTKIYKAEVIYPTLGLNGEAGEVAEKVKKIIRDQDGQFLPQDVVEVSKELGDILWYIANLATDLGVNLDEIANQNLQKLFSRKDRSKLSGSGDNR